MKLGYSIQKCVKLLESNAIMNRDEAIRKSCDDFVTLYDTIWASEVAKRATEVMDKARWSKPIMIPMASDVAKMNVHIPSEEK